MNEQNNFQNNNENNNIDNNNNVNNENDNIFSSTNTAMNNHIVTTLIEFGYDPTYSKRVFIYLHPTNIEEAIEYLSTENGMIQHNFVQDRNFEIDLCYICGQEKNIHINNNNQVNNNNEEDNKDINNEEMKSDENEEQKIECLACEELFIETKENKLEKCGHSFCNICWFNYLSVNINENKIASIQCLANECQEEPDEDFIINLIKSDQNLVNKYKKFKYELEIINNQNKKFCPFPNCNSFLELKDINNKEVKCSNNHAFCFICLEEPHGNSPCKENLLKNSLSEYSKDNLIKKCPKCSIITEKIIGCNHITCPKCNYQWCWLCNGEYDPEHYLKGKCKGFQFFRPQNEEEIKKALLHKIELDESQKQNDIDYNELNRSFYNQNRKLFISSNDIPAQNNDNQSADLILMQKNYVYDNEQEEEISENIEQNEADDSITDEQNNENERGNGNDNLNNSLNNEQNDLNNNKDSLFNIRNHESENKVEDKEKSNNINDSNRNFSNEINNDEKNNLNGIHFKNEDENDIVNFMTIDNEGNNEINSNRNFSNEINNNEKNDLNGIHFKNEDENDIVNFMTIDNEGNNEISKDFDKNDKNNNNNGKIINSETDQIIQNNVITYKRNNRITDNDIIITDKNGLLTSKELFTEKENKDNYKNKKNLQKNITLDIYDENSDNRVKEENENKNEKKSSQLSISYKILLTIIYFLFGHCLIFTNNFLEIIKKDYYKLSFLLIVVPYFFIQILINILLFFPYIFKDGFYSFLSEFCYIIKFKYSNLDQFPFHFAFYSAQILFLGTFLGLIKILCKLLNKKNTFITFFGILLGIAFFPFHIIINIIMLIYFFYKDGYDIKQVDFYLTN